ncbi:MAG: TonB family protein [Pseudomonadota bacterium]
MLSIVLHTAVVAALIFFSLFYVQDLPDPSVLVTFFTAPPPPPPPPSPPPQAVAQQLPKQAPAPPKPEDIQPPENLPETKIVEPKSAPKTPQWAQEGQPGGVVGGVPGGMPQATIPKQEKPVFVKPEVVDKLKISGNQPEYLPAARIARIEGVIIIKVCLATDGTVNAKQTQILKGIPILNAEVLEKVKTWRYRPYAVNGLPIPVCFPVRFVFRLN